MGHTYGRDTLIQVFITTYAAARGTHTSPVDSGTIHSILPPRSNDSQGRISRLNLRESQFFEGSLTRDTDWRMTAHGTAARGRKTWNKHWGAPRLRQAGFAPGRLHGRYSCSFQICSSPLCLHGKHCSSITSTPQRRLPPRTGEARPTKGVKARTVPALHHDRAVVAASGITVATNHRLRVIPYRRHGRQSRPDSR